MNFYINNIYILLNVDEHLRKKNGMKRNKFINTRSKPFCEKLIRSTLGPWSYVLFVIVVFDIYQILTIPNRWSVAIFFLTEDDNFFCRNNLNKHLN